MALCNAELLCGLVVVVVVVDDDQNEFGNVIGPFLVLSVVVPPFFHCWPLLKNPLILFNVDDPPVVVVVVVATAAAALRGFLCEDDDNDDG